MFLKWIFYKIVDYCRKFFKFYIAFFYLHFLSFRIFEVWWYCVSVEAYWNVAIVLFPKLLGFAEVAAHSEILVAITEILKKKGYVWILFVP